PFPRAQQVARLLAAQARLPRRVARPPREGKSARGRVGRPERRVRLPGPARRARAARAPPCPVLARASVPQVKAGRVCAAGLAFIATVLAVDGYVDLRGQLLLGVLTWIALLTALRLFEPERRAQALVVVAAATCG